jgi:hypothetical protein
MGVEWFVYTNIIIAHAFIPPRRIYGEGDRAAGWGLISQGFYVVSALLLRETTRPTCAFEDRNEKKHKEYGSWLKRGS